MTRAVAQSRQTGASTGLAVVAASSIALTSHTSQPDAPPGAFRARVLCIMDLCL